MEKEVIEEKKPKEKKNGGSAAAIIILVIIVIGFMVYIAYDKGYIFKSKESKTKNKTPEVETNNNEQKEKPATENKKDIDIEDSRFIDIYNKLASYTYTMNRENGYKSFSDKDLATLAIKDFKESDFVKTDEKDKETDLTYYKFSGNTIIKYLKKYFSSDVELDKNKLADLFVATNVNFDGSGMQIKSYDKDKDEYIVTFAGIGNTNGPSAKITTRKIVSATKDEDNSITVTEKAIYYTSSIHDDDMYYSIYSDPSNNYYIDGKHYKVSTITNEKITVNDYLDKASTITYVFKQDEDTGRYYFASSSIK